MKDRKLLKIFLTFFKVGFFTVGGGLAMLPVIRDEFCVKNNYFKENEMMDLIAMTQTTPGVMAANMAAFVGYRLYRLKGAVVAVLGAILPSFFIVLIIALFYNNFMDNLYVQKAFMGLRAVIAAAVVIAGIQMSKSAIKTPFEIVLAVSGGIIVYLFDRSVIYVIIAAAIISIIYYSLKFRQTPS